MNHAKYDLLRCPVKPLTKSSPLRAAGSQVGIGGSLRGKNGRPTLEKFSMRHSTSVRSNGIQGIFIEWQYQTMRRTRKQSRTVINQYITEAAIVCSFVCGFVTASCHSTYNKVGTSLTRTSHRVQVNWGP